MHSDFHTAGWPPSDCLSHAIYFCAEDLTELILLCNTVVSCLNTSATTISTAITAGRWLLSPPNSWLPGLPLAEPNRNLLKCNKQVLSPIYREESMERQCGNVACDTRRVPKECKNGKNRVIIILLSTS